MDFISKLVVWIVANLVVDIGVYAQTRYCGTKYESSIKTAEFVASSDSSEVKVKEVIAEFKIFLVQIDR